MISISFFSDAPFINALIAVSVFPLLADDSFSAVLSTAMKSVDETNDLQNTAESEEVRFALGEAENPHDLLIAETKANVALQYTVAVRDKLIDGYKEIMQMSI